MISDIKRRKKIQFVQLSHNYISDAAFAMLYKQFFIWKERKRGKFV